MQAALGDLQKRDTFHIPKKSGNKRFPKEIVYLKIDSVDKNRGFRLVRGLGDNGV